MPLYDYDCAACARRFELIHGVHADAPTTCPLCGSGPIRKAIVAPTVHYKGSGWAKKERRATASTSASSNVADEPSDAGKDAQPAAASSAESASSSDAGSTASKADAKTPTKASAVSGD